LIVKKGNLAEGITGFLANRHANGVDTVLDTIFTVISLLEGVTAVSYAHFSAFLLCLKFFILPL